MLFSSSILNVLFVIPMMWNLISIFILYFIGIFIVYVIFNILLMNSNNQWKVVLFVNLSRFGIMQVMQSLNLSMGVYSQKFKWAGNADHGRDIVRLKTNRQYSPIMPCCCFLLCSDMRKLNCLLLQTQTLMASTPEWLGLSKPSTKINLPFLRLKFLPYFVTSEISRVPSKLLVP